MSNRLEKLPISVFAIVLGLAGLTISVLRYEGFQSIPPVFTGFLTGFTLTVFLFFLGAYFLKYFRFKEVVKHEMIHPVKSNFNSAISISFMLLAVILLPTFPEIAKWFWIVGAVLHAFLTFYMFSFWINHNFEIHHSNPAWFIPIVGNVVAPIAGVEFAPDFINIFFFTIGIFFWLILLTIILNRIIFHNPLPGRIIPTLFILIAPPAIGFVSYVKLFGQVDIFAMALYSLALFFFVLLLFMYKNFSVLKFALSWWAFTFPLAALTISTEVFFHFNPTIWLHVFSGFMVILTIVVITGILIRTLRYFFSEEWLQSED